MAAIYNPWGGMGKVSPASVTGENPWARFTNTGDSAYKDRNVPFQTQPTGGPSQELRSSLADVFTGQPWYQSAKNRDVERVAAKATPMGMENRYELPGFLGGKNRENPINNVLGFQKQQVQDLSTDLNARYQLIEKGKRMGLWGPGAENDPTIANMSNAWLQDFIMNVENPNRNKGSLGRSLLRFLPIALSIAMPALAGPAAAGGAAAAEGGAAAGGAAAGAGTAAGAGGWAVGAGEALGGGLGSAFGATEGAALGAGAAGASEFVPALASAADPIQLGTVAMETTGAATFTEAANALGYETFAELAGAINPAWVGQAASTGLNLSPRVKNTLIRSGTGAASNPREPLKGAALGALSANLPSVTNPAIEKLGLPDWASRGLSSATNSSILQAIGEGRVDPKTVLQKLAVGSAGGLSDITGADPAMLENIAGLGMGGLNRILSSNDIRKQITERMLGRGRQQSDLGINTPSQAFDPSLFLEQDTQQREFNKRREAVAARNAEIQREFQRRKAQATTLNPELFSGR